MTKICCNVESCKYQETLPQYIKGKNGHCILDFIILQPCAADADNVVVCSEFTEREDKDNES